MMVQIFWLLVLSVIVALVAAFVVLLVKKWGIAEWMQVHGDDFSSRLFSCDLCMSWWACVLVTVVMVCVFGELSNVAYMSAPVLATPIARYLV